jgi:hypothetical protein
MDWKSLSLEQKWFIKEMHRAQVYLEGRANNPFFTVPIADGFYMPKIKVALHLGITPNKKVLNTDGSADIYLRIGLHKAELRILLWCLVRGANYAALSSVKRMPVSKRHTLLQEHFNHIYTRATFDPAERKSIARVMEAV